MADISSHHPDEIPVEQDGISYSGIVWFVVVLTAITLACQALMAGMFFFMQRRTEASDAGRSVLAAPAMQAHPGPTLLGVLMPSSEPTVIGPSEPNNLRSFREREDAALAGYGWVDKNAGTVRIPIERAKELLLERGLPVRGQTPSHAPAAEGKSAGVKKQEK
jgi:hypothetical protein